MIQEAVHLGFTGREHKTIRKLLLYLFSAMAVILWSPDNHKRAEKRGILDGNLIR